MVMVNDATNNCDASALRTIYIEYNIIQFPEYTNILKCTQTGMIIRYHETNM
jgi:hypothetical protein